MKKRTIGIIILIFYFIYTYYLAYLPLEVFNIDLSTLSVLVKIAYLLIFDLGLILILYFVYRKDFKHDIKDFKKNWKKYLKMGFKYWLIGLAIMGISNLLIQIFVTSNIAENEESVRTLIKSFPLYMLFATCIYAPIVEETIFRKTLKEIIGYNLIFVFVSGVLFGSLHVLGSMTSVTDLYYIIPYSSVGIAFAYLYYKTRNICSTIVMHFIHNTIFVTLEILILFL